LTGSPVQTSSKSVLDLEIPLPTTYLMSKARLGALEDFVDLPDTIQQSSLTQATSSAAEFSAIQTHIQEERSLLCLQQVDGSLTEAYWDQSRSMNAVIGIVVLFLVVVLVAEVTDKLFEVLVPSFLEA
jgi:hypothetical protein